MKSNAICAFSMVIIKPSLLHSSTTSRAVLVLSVGWVPKFFKLGNNYLGGFLNSSEYYAITESLQRNVFEYKASTSFTKLILRDTNHTDHPRWANRCNKPS